MPSNLSARSKKFSTRAVCITEASTNPVCSKFGCRTFETTQGSISTKCACRKTKPSCYAKQLLPLLFIFSFAFTSEHPRLIASIPTDPVPLYKSNHLPGRRDVGQPPAAYTAKSKESVLECSLVSGDMIRSSHYFTWRIPKAAPLTTSIIGLTSIPLRESNFFRLAVPAST